ncbi:hypothetical protein OM076_27575 [Solirubrobacter ginsenosidimutans]|uniref:DUF3352 domain-containing protein n=1 Tax=Solirubrobacter ginsenosidimutans TaxID=490573 RepID=A0A9X3MWJ5_9ACTN|nr:hypothetical protein [Solirubrobacter ginsenosidimutans]MDA0164064.1 hypothetical protein [Solirubrobacter ginsenosidimutans]
MRRLVAIIAAVAICVASAGCGSSDGAETARHLDPRSDAVVAIDLDYASANWKQVKRLYARAVREGGLDAGEFTPPTLNGALEALTSSTGLSFADDILPLLGGTLQLGVRTEPAPPLSASARDVLERFDSNATRVTGGRSRYFDYDGKPMDPQEVESALREQDMRQPSTTVTAAYRVADADALERALGKLRDQGLESTPIAGIDGARRLGKGVGVLGDDTLVAVLADDEDQADALLRERLKATGDGPAMPELGESLVAAHLAPTVLGAWLDREELQRALASTAGRALRSTEVRLKLDQEAARATALMDFEGLADDELPLPGPGPLALPSGEGVSSASADQSRTTVFLARLARELYPDSRFVRRVERLEAREGLKFEDAVLRQFSGPSFSVLRPGRDGSVAFGARSTLRDPAAMRALLDRIAPDLPGILEGLQGLGATGLTSLLLVAPDAPLTPAAFALLAGVDVRKLAAAGSEQLYEVTGLENGSGPNRVVYGLIGDAFVVASSAELAREVAAMRTEPAPEAATRVRVDFAALLERAGGWLGEDTARAVRALVAGADVNASAKDGDVVGEAEVRWAR